MSLLYPLFLLAGLALVIPMLIHLFNLRRYKTVFFPHTRFLKNIQLNSRRQSQVRYKWLLAARLLLLALLILAFAQPFLNNNSKKVTGNRLQVIYIDNSYSMSVKKGARTLLDIAKEKAIGQLQITTGNRYLLLTNDKPVAYQPQTADKIKTEISTVDISAASKTADQVLTTVQSMLQNETAIGADVYYYSDFQRNAVATNADASLLKNIYFYGIPVQTAEAQNVYIDTAYLTTPVLLMGQSNQLVVHTRNVGEAPKEPTVLQLSVNGQVKSAADINFSDKKESTDTISFQVNDANWQQMQLTVNDAAVQFDDTFRIAARSSPNLSVLVLNEGQPSPYIQAAFRAYTGFKLTQADINSTPANWKDYNLVILNGLTHIAGALSKTMATAMQQGQSICIFPGKTASYAQLNDGLKPIGDIHITGLDTAVQTVSAIQQGSSLVKDIFEKIPDNIQLPVSNWHYTIESGLSANRQSILSFRNGDPFLARYTPTKGQLYLCAAAADIQAGNFAASYFFVPFIYQMAAQSKSGDIYAVDAGSRQPVYLSLTNTDERNMVHAFGKGIDAIPPQQPNGAGLDVYINQAVHQPGFYTLAANGSDTTMVALNQGISESAAAMWSLSELKNNWKGDDIKWMDISNDSKISTAGSGGSFPLWKLCVILALLMLSVETYLLAGGFRKQNIATQ